MVKARREDTDVSVLTCPKCHGDMRQYERSGIHVDQCTECRGIFLDRGELEGLIDAEMRWAAQSAAPAQAAPAPVPAAPVQHGYPPQQQYGKPPKKRKSFLEDLFE